MRSELRTGSMAGLVVALAIASGCGDFVESGDGVQRLTVGTEGGTLAIGEFALITEPIPGADSPGLPERDPAAVHLHAYERSPEGGVVPPSLTLCRGCNQYIWPHETDCPHCGADVAAAAAQHEIDSARRRALILETQRLLDEARAAKQSAAKQTVAALPG